MQHQNRGILIVVEGIDGSGKSTLLDNLYKQLVEQKLPVILTKEPGGTATGKHLRTMLLGTENALMPKTEYLLFAADHAQHIHEVVIPHLQKGYIVLSDRMADSAYAYQGYGRGIDKNIISTVNTWIMDGINPDMTIYVKIPVTTAMERIRARGAHINSFEKQASFLERVTQGFEELYQDRQNLIIIDGLDTQDNMVHTAYTRLTDHFKSHFICQQK